MIRLPTISAVVFAGSALLAPASALACNPLEALFGACRMDVFRPSYQYREDVYRPRPARRGPHAGRALRTGGVKAARNENGVSGKETPIAPTPEAPTGSLALFRKDPTLRAGDVVVTNDGFKIFSHGEFRAIAEKGKLADLEKASMNRRPRSIQLQSVADRRR